jgi:hypothetical protein
VPRGTLTGSTFLVPICEAEYVNRLSGGRLEKVLDGEEMTGREAALIVALWLVLTAVFGIIVFVAVFVL